MSQESKTCAQKPRAKPLAYDGKLTRILINHHPALMISVMGFDNLSLNLPTSPRASNLTG